MPLFAFDLIGTDGVILGLIFSNLAMAYRTWRRERRADVPVDDEHQTDVIAQWQTWGRQQARERAAERARADALAGELTEVKIKLAVTSMRAAYLEEKIATLTDSKTHRAIEGEP